MEAGAVIWVKYAGWPLWPARVAKLCEASPLVMKAQRKDRFLVYFFGSHDYAWIPHNQAEPFDLDSMPEKRQLNIKDKKQAVMHSDGIAEAIEWITDKSKWTFPDYNTQPSQDSDTESQYVESQLAESEEEEGEKEEEEEEEVETPPPTKKRKVIAIEPPKNELKKKQSATPKSKSEVSLSLSDGLQDDILRTPEFLKRRSTTLSPSSGETPKKKVITQEETKKERNDKTRDEERDKVKDTAKDKGRESKQSDSIKKEVKIKDATVGVQKDKKEDLKRASSKTEKIRESITDLTTNNFFFDSDKKREEKKVPPSTIKTRSSTLKQKTDLSASKIAVREPPSKTTTPKERETSKSVLIKDPIDTDSDEPRNNKHTLSKSDSKKHLQESLPRKPSELPTHSGTKSHIKLPPKREDEDGDDECESSSKEYDDVKTQSGSSHKSQSKLTQRTKREEEDDSLDAKTQTPAKIKSQYESDNNRKLEWANDDSVETIEMFKYPESAKKEGSFPSPSNSPPITPTQPKTPPGGLNDFSQAVSIH